MQKKYMQMENDYIEHFSKKETQNGIIRYDDEKLTDMYTNNFTLLKEDNNIVNVINEELNKRKVEGKTFLRIETYFKINNETLNKISMKATLSSYDFMWIDPANFKQLNGNSECFIKEANTEEILEKGMKADILCNQGAMGEFAKRRIERKAQVYQDPSSKIKFYVCFYNHKAIGNCEMMIDETNKIAKIEDFDILETQQRKGFGTTVLKHLLETAYKNEIHDVYLITDSDDTAKEMYQKCGFTKIGEKYELFFQL